MAEAELQDHMIDVGETARVAHSIHEVCNGEEAPVIIAALIAELVTRLVGPRLWTGEVFAKLVSDVAQCVQALTWTAGQRQQH